jgi:hypothetical protein
MYIQSYIHTYIHTYIVVVVKKKKKNRTDGGYWIVDGGGGVETAVSRIAASFLSPSVVSGREQLKWRGRFCLSKLGMLGMREF